MLGGGTGRYDFGAVGIEGSRWVLDVLSVVRVERKSVRVIEKSSGKTRRANSRETTIECEKHQKWLVNVEPNCLRSK
jgi:hypothetical protein